MDENIDLTPKNDVIFKKLFGDQRHPKFLIALLNTILKPESPIKKVTIKNSELTPEFVGQKGVRLDVLAETEDSHMINVEIQKKDEKNMRNRVPFNAAKVLVAEAVQGQEYQDMKKVTTINIINFKLFDSDNYWNKFFLMNPETGEKLTDLLAIHFFELPKVPGPSIDEPVTFWLEFIKNPEAQQVKGDYKWNCVYDELKQRYDEIVSDPEIRELIRVRDKAERDYNSAILQARMDGEEIAKKKFEKERKKAEAKAQRALEKERQKAEQEKAKAYQEKIESTKSLLRASIPIEVISDSLGLPVEEIQKLK